MATYYARKSGNINAADIWSTTPTGTVADVFSSFTSSDILVANSFTIAININTTVAELHNDTTGGATNGGTYNLNNGITLTSSIINGGSATVVNYSATGTSTIIGTINARLGGSSCVICSGSGTLNIIGNIYGASTSGANAINLMSSNSMTINITGNIYGGLANGEGVRNSGSLSTQIINVIGNVIGGDNGSFSYGINNYGGNGVGSCVTNITGTVIGGLGAAGINVTTGTVNIIGISMGGPVATGSNNGSSAGILNVKRAKGNGYGPGSTGLVSQVGVISGQASATYVQEIEYGELGQSPTGGPIALTNLSSNVAVFAVRLSSARTLVDSSTVNSLIPSSGDVRSGVTYNQGNNTGSCIIPNANSVVYGVAVDNTIGSGLLSPVAVWNVLASNIAISGSIGQRLKNCSTVSTVGKQLEGAL